LHCAVASPPPRTHLALTGLALRHRRPPPPAAPQVPSLLSRGRRVQLVSVEDVAWFACAAFERPADFVGRRIELAGDERSAEELCEAIARVRGEAGRWHVVSAPAS